MTEEKLYEIYLQGGIRAVAEAAAAEEREACARIAEEGLGTGHLSFAATLQRQAVARGIRERSRPPEPAPEGNIYTIEEWLWR